jgi:LUC7 N_terminus
VSSLLYTLVCCHITLLKLYLALFTIQDVCKFYVLGICPYALFSNTKSDLGEHPHGEEDVDDLKEMYEVCRKSIVPQYSTLYNVATVAF